MFTSLLHTIENENVQPTIYKQGSQGGPPSGGRKSCYIRNEEYVFHYGNVLSKPMPEEDKEQVAT